MACSLNCWTIFLAALALKELLEELEEEDDVDGSFLFLFLFPSCNREGSGTLGGLGGLAKDSWAGLVGLWGGDKASVVKVSGFSSSQIILQVI